jgi:Ca2+-binding RTX toxin-like protein
MRRTILLFTLMAAALLVGGGVALAASVSEVEPNDKRVSAQNIDGSFSLDSDPNIGNRYINTSEIVPHATVNGTGNNTIDVYSFTVSQAGDGVIIDVDGALVCDASCVGFDSRVDLSDGSQLLDGRTDSSTAWGQGGSVSNADSYLEYTFQTPGTYYVTVGSEAFDDSLRVVPEVDDNGNPISYQLHISLGELPYYCQGLNPTIEAQPGQAVKGTKGDDVIAGTEGPDTINGRGGNDTICGRDGTNTINGEDGEDSISSGSSNDSITGGVGNDSMFGGEGNDQIMGDRGDDTLYGNGGDDTLNGGVGRDFIDGGDGTDKCSRESDRLGCELALH